MIDDTNFTFPYNPPEKWMSFLSDSIPLSNLKIPGTHNSGTGSNPSKKLVSRVANFAAYCHTLDIPTQLRRGIRYIDIRLKLEPTDELYIYHKVVRYEITFPDVLNEISRFLDENPKECIMIRLHREDGDPGGKFYRNNVSDEMFINKIVNNLQEFSDRERQKRISENEQLTSSNNIQNDENNNNNNDNLNNSNQDNSNSEDDNDYLNIIYNEENDNPLLGNIRRKVILFGILHIAHTELLSASPFRFRKINKQADYKLKCNDNDINKKMNSIIDGFRKSKSLDLQNDLFINEINAIGSIPILHFIPDPRKMAETMNNMVESILIKLIRDKIERKNHSNNENGNNNDDNNNDNSSQNENDNLENDFQGVLMFDFPEVSKGGKLIELVYSQNDY